MTVNNTYYHQALDDLVRLSERSRSLPPEERGKIDHSIQQAMRGLEATNKCHKMLVHDANRRADEMSSQLDRIGRMTAKFQAPEARESRVAEAQASNEPNKLKKVRQKVDEGLERITSEKRTWKERWDDTKRQLQPEAAGRRALAKEVKTALGPSMSTKAAVGATKIGYKVGKLTGRVEENEAVEIGFAVHDARVMGVKELRSMIKDPERAARKYKNKFTS